jgi:hypothetical protein
MGFSVWAGHSGVLPSPGDGGPEARLRSASRILGQSAREFVATSLWQIAFEYSYPSHIHPGDLPSWCGSTEPKRRLPFLLFLCLTRINCLIGADVLCYRHAVHFKFPHGVLPVQ